MLKCNNFRRTESRERKRMSDKQTIINRRGRTIKHCHKCEKKIGQESKMISQINFKNQGYESEDEMVIEIPSWREKKRQLNKDLLCGDLALEKEENADEEKIIVISNSNQRTIYCLGILEKKGSIGLRKHKAHLRKDKGTSRIVTPFDGYELNYSNRGGRKNKNRNIGKIVIKKGNQSGEFYSE